MRLHIGQPPATPDFMPKEEGWTPLKEPSPLVLNLVATPVGVLAAVLIAFAWGTPSVRLEGGPTSFGLLGPLIAIAAIFGIGFLLLVAAHELIHALGYPKFGFTPSTMIAFWPSKLLFLAIHYDALPRNRLLLVYLLPLLVISVFPLIVCRSLGIESVLLMLASIANALVAGGDIFCFFLILAQVPANALVRNQGWATWWKSVDGAGERSETEPK